MNTWDAHNNLKANHELHANASDLPIAGLLTDLKARGLLNDTLVIWHGEFGRMPISQRGVGRDHNPGAPAPASRAARSSGRVTTLAIKPLSSRLPFTTCTPPCCICSAWTTPS